MRYNNYFAYFDTFGAIRESHQTEFCYSSFTTDRMEQGMVTRSLDREIAGSGPHCIHVSLFTGSPVLEWRSETQILEGECRLGSTKVHFMYGVLSKCGNELTSVLIKFQSYTCTIFGKILV